MKYLIYLYFIVFVFIAEKGFSTGDKFKKYDYNSGLTDNHITSQIIDKNNFIWIGTSKGLNKFDGYNYIYYTKENNKLPDNKIQSLALNDSLIYVATFYCVVKINIHNNIIDKLKFTNRGVNISNIFYTSNKLLVIYYEDGWVHFYNDNNKLLKKILFGKQNYASIEECDEQLFIAIQGKGIVMIDLKKLSINKIQEDHVLYGNSFLKRINNIGLFHITPDGLKKYNRYTKLFEFYGKNFNGTTCINGLNDSMLVIVSKNSHVKLFNTKKNIFLETEFKVPANAFIESVNSNYDNIILGTNQGLIVFKINSGTFEKLEIENQSSIIPRKIIESNNGDLYFFHYNGIHLKDKKNNFLHAISKTGQLHYSAVEIGNYIYSGTEGVGIFRIDKRTNVTENILKKEHFPKGIAHIVTMLKLSESKILLGCHPGLYIYDIPTNKMIPLQIYTSGKNLYKLKYGLNLFDLKYKHFIKIEDEIWCATNKGIIILDNNLKYVDIINKNNTNSTLGLVCDTVNYIYEQNKNTIWIGTDKGFQKYNRIKNNFEAAYTQDKIKSNCKIIAILPDRQGRLWMPTFYGLILFDPGKNIVSAYHQHDGLVNEEYNFASYCRLKNGNIVLGGVNGYQLIIPERLSQNQNKIKLQVTDILKLGDNNEFESLNNTNKINLNLESDFIQVRFSTNQYYHTESLSYYYRTDTLANWISTNNLPLINISYLPTNTSYIYIKVINNDNVTEQHEIKIPVFVKTKIYKEWWFIPSILFVFLSLFTIVLILWYRFSSMKKVQQQRKESENALMKNLNKEKELNSLKTKFIKLISHEYRTPLTGITTSVDLMEMLLNSPQTETSLLKERRHMKNIRLQVDRMSKLIKGVQSLNRMEDYISRINFETVEIVSFVKYNIDLLVPSNFKTSYNNDNNLIETKIDKDILQQIISNIISNSLKYSTSERKEIVIYTSLVDNTHYSILICDYGIGISAKDLPYVFNTFYRGANAENIQGIGLGLSITKQLVEQMNGEIDIQSSSEYGTSVSLTFPIVS